MRKWKIELNPEMSVAQFLMKTTTTTPHKDQDLNHKTTTAHVPDLKTV